MCGVFWGGHRRGAASKAADGAEAENSKAVFSWSLQVHESVLHYAKRNPTCHRSSPLSPLPTTNAAISGVVVRPRRGTASTVSPRPTHTHQVQHHLQTLHNQATNTTTTHRTHATYIPTHPYPMTASPRITSAAGKDVCFCAMPPRPGLTGESRPLRSRLSTRGGGTQTPTSHTSPKKLECPRTGIAHANAPHKFPV